VRSVDARESQTTNLYRLLASRVTQRWGPPDTQITEAVETIDRDVMTHLGYAGLLPT
jgi:hypothetical protein